MRIEALKQYRALLDEVVQGTHKWSNLVPLNEPITPETIMEAQERLNREQVPVTALCLSKTGEEQFRANSRIVEWVDWGSAEDYDCSGFIGTMMGMQIFGKYETCNAAFSQACMVTTLPFKSEAIKNFIEKSRRS